MASAYSVFVNGGYLVEPYFIERIEGSDGKSAFERITPLSRAIAASNRNPSLVAGEGTPPEARRRSGSPQTDESALGRRELSG